MKPSHSPPSLSTVSHAFIQDWLGVLQAHCTPAQLQRFLDETDLASGADQPLARVTHDQIVRLYQLVAVETGDEMMGLWSRPIRKGALKHLCVSVRGAASLGGALYRFATFWNLLLDDYFLELQEDGDILRLRIRPNATPVPNRFGHMLLLKLNHGITSWLAGRELPLREVGFVFQRPEFAQDYPILFPAPVRFGQPCSYIGFDRGLGGLEMSRTDAEMQEFLQRAPRDWIFTSYREHALSLRIREFLFLSDNLDFRLKDAARALNMTPRTLMRRLDDEQTSFRAIRDGLRRDTAIRELTQGSKSLEAISQDVGFSSAASFHRAFRTWTGMTPGSYRRKQRRGTVGP
ncbi:AraC family transcriptional regulator ligand-binding domain-containing protein [Sedimentitalea sp. HM32M-2]|uniref:AraC family transcriptional regulator n=1 Tax=Sedimentitalea sp. HM32M-2 TaxID=3351566 RepID=UPI0036441F45